MLTLLALRHETVSDERLTEAAFNPHVASEQTATVLLQRWACEGGPRCHILKTSLHFHLLLKRGTL